jgi:hypothetical protein
MISKRNSPPVKVAGASLVICPGRKERRVWRVFLPSFSHRSFSEGGQVHSFIEHYECRNTILMASRE